MTNELIVVHAEYLMQVNAISGYTNHLTKYEVSTYSTQSILNIAAYSDDEGTDGYWFVLQVVRNWGFRIVEVSDLTTQSYLMTFKIYRPEINENTFLSGHITMTTDSSSSNV